MYFFLCFNITQINMWFSTTVSLLLIQLAMAKSENCTELLNGFASSTAEFVSCSIRCSRPVTLCGACVHYYINITNSYNKMEKFSENGTHCIDKYVNLDRLQIVQTLYSTSCELWNNAKCNECFEFFNGTLTPNRSEKAKTFNKKYQKFQNCTEKTNNDTVCSMCMNDYLDLDEYYSKISNENEKIGGCMDIVDSMNTTRFFWSGYCCKYRRHNESIFIGSTITVLIVTICFYVVVQFYSVKKPPTVLQQTRFAESLNQLNHLQ